MHNDRPRSLRTLLEGYASLVFDGLSGESIRVTRKPSVLSIVINPERRLSTYLNATCKDKKTHNLGTVRFGSIADVGRSR
jgi:hypothetical protein